MAWHRRACTPEKPEGCWICRNAFGGCAGCREQCATHGVANKLRSCTCLGSCKGVGGLAEGWQCEFLGRGPTQLERDRYQAAIAELKAENEK